MPKRLVVACDGTWSTADQRTVDGRPSPTNVTRVAEAIADKDNNGNAQIPYYGAGVGSIPGERLRGGIFGWGLSREIKRAYQFLVVTYEPGDELYFFTSSGIAGVPTWHAARWASCEMPAFFAPGISAVSTKHTIFTETVTIRRDPRPLLPSSSAALLWTPGNQTCSSRCARGASGCRHQTVGSKGGRFSSIASAWKAASTWLFSSVSWNAQRLLMSDTSGTLLKGMPSAPTVSHTPMKRTWVDSGYE